MAVSRKIHENYPFRNDLHVGETPRLGSCDFGVAKMQRAYLDCKFTSLDPYYELISLALVVPNGPEFYGEIDDGWILSDCSNFVQKVVLPLLDLDKYGRTQSRAADELQHWLSQFDGLEIIQ